MLFDVSYIEYMKALLELDPISIPGQNDQTFADNDNDSTQVVFHYSQPAQATYNHHTTFRIAFLIVYVCIKFMYLQGRIAVGNF